MTRAELLKIAKPILFNTEMVRAILDGKKTVTRRLVKFDGNRNPNWTGYIKDGLMLYNGTNEPCNKPAPFKIGDILYVRETWCWCPCWDCGFDTEEHKCIYVPSYKIFNDGKAEWGCYGYKASFEDNEYPSADTWHPSIHMPKEAARILLKVKNVRMERLKNITAEEIRNEGLASMAVHAGDMEIALKEWELLWNSTIKKSDLARYGWEANPWVWVIEFERIKPKAEQ